MQRDPFWFILHFHLICRTRSSGTGFPPRTAQEKNTTKAESQPLLALVHAHLDREAFLRHPTVPVYVEGCRRRAAELGYLLNEFWLYEPELDGTRFNKILRARNLRGLVIAPKSTTWVEGRTTPRRNQPSGAGISA